MASVANVRRIGVFIAADPDTKPTVDDYDPTTYAVEWGVVAGSGMWYAKLVSDLAKQERRLENMSLQLDGTRQVEIWEIDPEESDIRIYPLFWGEIVNQQIVLDGGVEQEQLTARIDPYHFPEVIRGQRVRINGNEKTVNIPLEFNPMVDGVIIPNRWKPTGDTNDWYHWIDPESSRTGESVMYQDDGGTAVPESWTIDSILQTLCEIANEDQTFVKNVAPYNYDAMLPDPPEINNIVLKTGAYLPEYLDNICQRLGYNWTVDVAVDQDNTPELKPKLRFFQQMEGSVKTVKMQAPGSVMDNAATTVSEFRMAAEVGQLSNIITGYGALIEREVKVPLYRSWDSLNDADYDHEDPHNIIGRKWVANEAGDYTGIRAEITDPLLLGEEWQVKRRVFEDCLTYRDNKRRPPFLEYRENSESEFKPVPNEWGYRILADEMGVHFTGHREEGSDTGGIPDEMLTSTVELWVTATIRGDTRPTHTSDYSANSPNANEIETVIDLSDRFFDRQRMTGPYAPDLTGPADERDDTDALVEYVAKIQEQSELADIQASITLFGLHFDDEYKVGDVISKLEGREISFERSVTDQQKYVQVVGITHRNNVAGQYTVLTVTPHGIAPQ